MACESGFYKKVPLTHLSVSRPSPVNKHLSMDSRFEEVFDVSNKVCKGVFPEEDMRKVFVEMKRIWGMMENLGAICQSPLAD